MSEKHLDPIIKNLILYLFISFSKSYCQASFSRRVNEAEYDPTNGTDQYVKWSRQWSRKWSQPGRRKMSRTGSQKVEPIREPKSGAAKGADKGADNGADKSISGAEKGVGK